MNLTSAEKSRIRKALIDHGVKTRGLSDADLIATHAERCGDSEPKQGIKNEDAPPYTIDTAQHSKAETTQTPADDVACDDLLEKCNPETILQAAAKILDRLAMDTSKRESITSPSESRTAVLSALQYQLATKQSEVFGIIYLTAQHAIIAKEALFSGTIDAAAVYPREVVKAALANNAAAVIFYHNHPSGLPEPSESDKRITTRLKEALATVDIRTLDHLVVAGQGVVSFAERGYL